MKLSSLSNFQQRFFMSFLGIVILASVILLSQTPPFGFLFVLALALIQAKALSEYYDLSSLKDCSPFKLMPIGFSVIYIFLHALFGTHELAVPFLFIVLALSFLRLFSKQEEAIVNLAITMFGLIYITIPLSFLIDINSQGSSLWLIYLIITTKMSDTFAYFAGKLFGNRLLTPTLSPKKTVEGAIGGLVGSILASVVFIGFAFGFTAIGWPEAIALGACIGIISQIGDLAESLLKRDAQVKDSSTLPGFGGMLDVVDSIIFTTPLLYYWLKVKGIL